MKKYIPIILLLVCIYIIPYFLTDEIINDNSSGIMSISSVYRGLNIFSILVTLYCGYITYTAQESNKIIQEERKNALALLRSYKKSTAAKALKEIGVEAHEHLIHHDYLKAQPILKDFLMKTTGFDQIYPEEVKNQYIVNCLSDSITTLEQELSKGPIQDDTLKKLITNTNDVIKHVSMALGNAEREITQLSQIQALKNA